MGTKQNVAIGCADFYDVIKKLYTSVRESAGFWIQSRKQQRVFSVSEGNDPKIETLVEREEGDTTRM